jgi:hypothetical protein
MSLKPWPESAAGALHAQVALQGKQIGLGF